MNPSLSHPSQQLRPAQIAAARRLAAREQGSEQPSAHQPRSAAPRQEERPLSDAAENLPERAVRSPGALSPAEPSPPAEFDAHTVWQLTLGELAIGMPSATFDTWLRDTRVLAYEDGEFIIGLPNAYARDWLENRLRTQVKRILRSIVHRSVQVKFRVCPPHGVAEMQAGPLYSASAGDEQAEPLPSPATPRDGDRRSASGVEISHNNMSHSTFSPARPRYISQLNANHTFETLVVGNHNRLAHAAASAIAAKPGQSFNPLFVYGGVGLGKTHLLHAIGNRAQQNGFQMLYCSSEQFTNELISAIRNQSTEEFRSKYRQVDILLIDDIQFIGGKESTQEEFFHTFNHLQASGGQVVLSSDRPPKALATLEERLRSRFEGGLQADISQPDFETRVAILQIKANKLGVPVAHDVLMLIAERVESNVRELEGALNHLYLQAQLLENQLTYSVAVGLLENLAPQRTPCTPASVVRMVAEHFSLTLEELTGRKRTKEIASARQVAMYLLREDNNLSLPAIGELLGGRDHTTVRYGVDRVAQDLGRDETLRQDIMRLRDKIYTPFVA